MEDEAASAIAEGDMVTAIKTQAGKVHGMAQARSLPLDSLRDETAALQALIAEAARLERLGMALSPPVPQPGSEALRHPQRAAV